MIQYKDCSVSCDPQKDGAGCNTGLQEVAEKYSEKQVTECHQCEYVQNLDGTVNGRESCGEEIIDSNDIPKYKCPLYADAACYWAASFHKGPFL